MAQIPRRVRQAGVYFVTSDTWERHATFINTELAKIVVGQILDCRERGFYDLHAFVVMPEHIHLLLTPSEKTTIERAIQMIKGGSARVIGLEIPQKCPVWHRGFHDRWVRDLEEYQNVKRYIEQNPVEAKLAGRIDEYPWSSASGDYAMDVSRFE